MSNNLFFFLWILSLSVDSFSQEESASEINNHACFFEESTIMPALGGKYGFQNSLVGGQFKLYYAINEKFCFGPELSYSYNSQIKSVEIGLVAHYIVDLKYLGIYPVLGINYLNESEHDHHFKGFGGLLGLGLHRNFKKFTVFVETTSFLGEKYEQNIVAGLFYRISIRK